MPSWSRSPAETDYCPTVVDPARTVQRFAAFSASATGGNPAGVVLDAADIGDQTMQRIAADVGYSETAFLNGGSPSPSAPIRVRYFSPEVEVAFCGHATIAAGVALGEAFGAGAYPLLTNAGPVNVEVRQVEGAFVATLESPPARAEPLPASLLDDLICTLGWRVDDLHPGMPPMVGFAGNRHPILVAAHLDRLASLSYDFPALQSLCRQHDWTTIHLTTPTGPSRWRARDPFPIGGVVEDPATGAAAAAFGGYLRALRMAHPGDRFTIDQGVEMGRPSRLDVQILDTTVLVSGTATRLDATPSLGTQRPSDHHPPLTDRHARTRDRR